MTNNPNGADLSCAGVTKTRCPACGAEEHWQVIAERYQCPKCGCDAVVVGATGHTIDEAIARAPAEMPDRVVDYGPRQATLPGVRPIFNFQSAYAPIVEKRAELRRADANAETMGDKFKALKKRADTIRGELDQLIDDFEERSRDARYETPADDRQADSAQTVVLGPDLVPVLPHVVPGEDVALVPAGEGVSV